MAEKRTIPFFRIGGGVKGGIRFKLNEIIEYESCPAPEAKIEPNPKLNGVPTVENITSTSQNLR